MLKVSDSRLNSSAIRLSHSQTFRSHDPCGLTEKFNLIQNASMRFQLIQKLHIELGSIKSLLRFDEIAESDYLFG